MEKVLHSNKKMYSVCWSTDISKGYITDNSIQQITSVFLFHFDIYNTLYRQTWRAHTHTHTYTQINTVLQTIYFKHNQQCMKQGNTRKIIHSTSEQKQSVYDSIEKKIYYQLPM